MTLNINASVSINLLHAKDDVLLVYWLMLCLTGHDIMLYLAFRTDLQKQGLSLENGDVWSLYLNPTEPCSCTYVLPYLGSCWSPELGKG